MATIKTRGESAAQAREEKERSRAEHLIIQTAFLGDLLLGIPLFKEFKRLYPEDRLTVLCRKGLGEFLVKSGLVDDVVEADKSSKESWQNAVRKLRSRRFEIVLCPHESFRSTMLAARLKARRKIAYPRFFNRFVFHDRVPRPMALPEALRQLALLTPFNEEWRLRLEGYERLQSAPGGLGEDGLAPVPEWASMTVPRLAQLRKAFMDRRELSSASSGNTRLIAERAGLLQESSRKIAFLAPGSVWPTKMWTADGFTRAARELQAKGYRVVLMGSGAERGICDEIAFRAPGAVSIAGETSLYESAELLALADLLICNDSGAMHMAAAAGVPTVSVFGPTVLAFGYRPWQNRARVVQVELPCRPCGKHGARACPLGTHECMKRVTAEAVLEAVEALEIKA